MAVTSGNTRRERMVARRRLHYTRRIDAATTDRERINALVGWWMAEWHRLSDADRRVEFGRLAAVCRELNDRMVTGGDGGGVMPVASASRGRGRLPHLLTRAREATRFGSTHTVTGEGI